MNKTEKITFRADEQLKQELARLSELQGISTGQLIRNWIEVFVKNQVSNSTMHSYQLDDGRQFPNMKSLCEELNISSRTARKRVKNGSIKRIEMNTYQTQKDGEEIHAARSGETEGTRIEF